MTNPWTAVAALLQALPASVRRTLYTLVTAAGAVLALAQFMGWDLGIDMEKALAAYAVLSSPTGALALANVKPGTGGFLPFDPDPEDRDVDVSSFEAWSVETDDDFDEFAGDLSTEPSEENAEESAFS